MIEPAYSPEPKSGCSPTPVPMKPISDAEFGSTGADEMSVFHRLSEGNDTKPLRLPPCPAVITLHAGGGGGGGPPPELPEVICKFCAPETLLPGSGFITVTAKVPTEAAVPVALSCVDETKVVASCDPASRRVRAADETAARQRDRKAAGGYGCRRDAAEQWHWIQQRNGALAGGARTGCAYSLHRY